MTDTAIQKPTIERDTRQKRGKDVEASRARVAMLYLQNTPLYLIAEQEHISPSQVTQDLKIIRQRWLDTQIESYSAVINQELDKLDLIEFNAWSAWDASRQPLQQTRTTRGKDYKRTRGENKGHTDQHSTMQIGTQPPMTTDGTTDNTGTSKSNGVAVIDRTVASTRMREGNPAFLKIILDCMAHRAKLLRLTDEGAVNINAAMVKVVAGIDLERV